MSATNQDVLNMIAHVWSKHYEMRFGQLVVNLARDARGDGDPWEIQNEAWVATCEKVMRGEALGW